MGVINKTNPKTNMNRRLTGLWKIERDLEEHPVNYHKTRQQMANICTRVTTS